MSPWPTIALLALLSLLTACGLRNPPGDRDAFTPVSGKAQLLSIDHALGIGTLEFHGKTINFWWKTKDTRPSVTASPNTSISAPWWSTAVSNELLAGADPNFPLETSDTDRPFNAQPGDMIYFRGFERHGEILLTVATAVKP